MAQALRELAIPASEWEWVADRVRHFIAADEDDRADLDATMLHPDEIASLAGAVVAAAGELGPLLGSVFGGTRKRA